MKTSFAKKLGMGALLTLLAAPAMAQSYYGNGGRDDGPRYVQPYQHDEDFYGRRAYEAHMWRMHEERRAYWHDQREFYGHDHGRD